MYSFFVYIIFATVFMLVQCDHARPKGDDDFTVVKKMDCPDRKSFGKELRDVMMNASCKPHYRHVTLRPMPPMEFNPAIVSVKRCDGNCPMHVCVPTKTRIVQIPVVVMNSDSSPNSCNVVEVEEHLSCSCMCIQQPEDCHHRQAYLRKSCRCECMDQAMNRERCEMKMGMYWDSKKCECKCAMQNMTCSTHYVWDSNLCQCKRAKR